MSEVKHGFASDFSFWRIFMEHALIGVTAQVDQEGRRWIRSSYTDAICRAGGVPVFLDYYTEKETLLHLCERLDGLLFTGGVDIHPRYYGETVENGCGEITEARDIFELALYRHARACGMPLLGICRGMQLFNVAEGGTLWQDMRGHSDTEHPLMLEGGTVLYEMLGACTAVNSFHHQAVKRVAKGCTVAAVAADGTIEGITRTDAPFWLGVQWHPELMKEKHTVIFDRFLRACAAYTAMRERC